MESFVSQDNNYQDIGIPALVPAPAITENVPYAPGRAPVPP
jgi:hypothetical protein